jgi:hypothetical protein
MCERPRAERHRDLFFLERKNQRTFPHLSRGGGNRSVSTDKSLFASVSQKKKQPFMGGVRPIGRVSPPRDSTTVGEAVRCALPKHDPPAVSASVRPCGSSRFGPLRCALKPFLPWEKRVRGVRLTPRAPFAPLQRRFSAVGRISNYVGMPNVSLSLA